MKRHLSSSSLFLLSWLLLSLVEPASCYPYQYLACLQQSCGNVQINLPFYLKSHASRCKTEPQFQLNCEGNKTIFDLFEPEKYIVTETGSNYINFVAERFVEGSCTVPTVSPSPEILENFYGAQMWGSLVKCRQLIFNSAIYKPVKCMSASNSFVYLVVGRNRVIDLQPSCSYLSMFPLSDLSHMSDNSTDDAFKLLQQGFLLFPFAPTEIIERIFTQIADIYGERMYIIRLLIAPVIFVFLAYILIKSKRSQDIVERFLQNQQSQMPTRYAYTDIITITGNFRQKLGQGGFGSVFKGVIPGGILVAVKMLGNSSCKGEDFISEVSTLGRIHHFNVVRLIGFCSEGSKRALIYEYMLNGSLDKHIFNVNRNRVGYRTFTLSQLNEIALGIARGIEYLHHGCDMQILHFDIKPNNILLDMNFIPKISDFGLAKLYPKECSLVTVSAARGTIGYVAPELISRSFGAISHKSDVYSFGMVLMEMVGGRRNADHNIGRSSQVYYPSWIYDKMIEQQRNDTNTNLHISEVEKKLCLIALWCIQIKSCDRPDMRRVIEMLQSNIDSLTMPPKPFFASDNSADTTEFKTCYSDQLSVISEFSE